MIHQTAQLCTQHWQWLILTICEKKVADFFRVYFRRMRASSALHPRIRSATSRAFLGDTLANRKTALASIIFFLNYLRLDFLSAACPR
jgi:hypothetical protein